MKKGFTILEVIVVVAIVGLLASIAVPSFIEANRANKLAEIGIKKAHPFFYNPETKEVVEINDDYTSITRVIGVLSVSIIQFEKTSPENRHKLISYRDSKAWAEVTKEEIVINGVTYKKVQQ